MATVSPHRFDRTITEDAASLVWILRSHGRQVDGPETFCLKRDGSGVKGITISQKRDQFFFVRLCIKPPSYPLYLGVIFRSESADVDLFQFLFPDFSLRAGLPEGSENRIQIVMQIALLQRLPLIPVEPDAFATLAMIDRKVEPASDQKFHHTESALRTIYRLT